MGVIDRDMDLANHKQVSINTGLQVYFADPRSPWQRGCNENANGLLRQYFPKGTSLKGFHQDELDEVARKLNTRPRKTLDYDAPAARLEELLHRDIESAAPFSKSLQPDAVSRRPPRD